MIYTVYILFSNSHSKIYIGYSSNLIKRFYSHDVFGNGWTRNSRPWKVIYYEYFQQKKDALNREKQLKTAKARAGIWKCIENEFALKGYITFSHLN